MHRSGRIVAGLVAGLIAVVVVRGGCGGGVSVGDLKKVTLAGITVELPGTPEPLEIPIPPEIRNRVVSMESYQKVKRTFMAAVSRVTYTPDVQASVDGALDGSISNVMTAQHLVKRSDSRSQDVAARIVDSVELLP